MHETTSRKGSQRAPRPADTLSAPSGEGPDSEPDHAEPEPIWDLVRRVRKFRGLTQYQLADLLAELSRNSSVSRDEVARWERGKRVPGPYWRRWLALALDVPPEQLATAVRHGRSQR